MTLRKLTLTINGDAVALSKLLSDMAKKKP